MDDRITKQVVLTYRAIPDENIPLDPIAFFDIDGNPITLSATADTISMTDYVSQEGYVVEETDSLNEAIAKLEGLIVLINEAIVALDGRVGAIEAP